MKIPCEYNNKAINRLMDALIELEKRKKDREDRGVEGTSKS